MHLDMYNEKKGKTMEIVKRSGWPGIGGWARVRVARRQEDLEGGNKHFKTAE